MGVNFHPIRESEAGVEAYECDDCDYEVDADHYGDMEAHDQWHYEQRERADKMPRAVVVKVGDKYHVGRRLGTWYDANDTYTEIGSSNDVDFAREITRRIQDGTIA